MIPDKLTKVHTAAMQQVLETILTESFEALHILAELGQKKLSPKRRKQLLISTIVTADNLRHATIDFSNKIASRKNRVELTTIKDLLLEKQ